MHVIFYVIVAAIYFHKFLCYRSRGNKLKMNEIENNINMIVKPIKKLSGIFPNHDIEVQFDIEQYHTTAPVVLLNSHKLDKSSFLDSPGRANTFGRQEVTARRDSLSPPSLKNLERSVYKDSPFNEIRRSNNLISTPSTSSTLSASTTLSLLDTDKQIVYMKDLKRALDELEKKLLTNISSNEGNQPLLRKDLWMALGIKNEKNCNQQEAKNDITSLSQPSIDTPTMLNMFNTLQKSGPIQNGLKPNGEDLSWIKIKLPV